MNISRRKFIFGGFLAFLGGLILNSLWFERVVLQYNFFDLAKGKTNKIKLVQLSDLHLQKLGRQHQAIAAKINKLEPDLVFFTGDAIDDGGKIAELDKFLSLLDQGIKKVAITGNWEYWGGVNIAELRDLYASHNCHLLVNESQRFNFRGRSIGITGIDDLVGGNADFLKAKNEIQKSDVQVVLTHCPAHRDIIQTQTKGLKIDLVLSGHTHGGQVNFFGIVPFKPQGSGHYLGGWYRESLPHLYVSRGIGTSILPIRFGSRAEVAVFEV